jgi:hypothetical protein
MIIPVKNFLNKKELKDVYDYFDHIIFVNKKINTFENENQQVPNSLFI